MMLFNTYSPTLKNNSKYPNKIKYSPIDIELSPEKSLFDFQRELLIKYDELFGITSYFQLTHDYLGNEILTEEVFIRDATKAEPLVNLHSDDREPAIINQVLRAISLSRSLMYVLDLNGYEDANDRVRQMFSEYFTEINKVLERLSDSPDKNFFSKIKSLEKQFNTKTLNIIKKYSLDADISNEDYSKLLQHYRDMSALLDPAVTFQTITNIENSDYFCIQTACPITQKTDEQKANIEIEVSTNIHKIKSAFSIVNKTYLNLLIAEDRRLPAQSRKNIGNTLKNAYAATTQLAQEKQGEFIVVKSQTKLRFGSLVYVGKNSVSERTVDMARMNVEQLTLFMQKNFESLDFTECPAVLITILNTESNLNSGEKSIVSNSIQAIRQVENEKAYFANIPVNDLARVEKPAIQTTFLDKYGKEKIDEINIRNHHLSKADRYLDAVEFSIFYTKNENRLIRAYCCASGQDRTGTACAKDDFYNIELDLTSLGYKITAEEVENNINRGMHNPMLASWVAPGSPGFKTDSKSETLFASRMTTHGYYTQVAKTNKNPGLQSSNRNSYAEITLNGKANSIQRLTQNFLQPESISFVIRRLFDELKRINETFQGTGKLDEQNIARPLHLLDPELCDLNKLLFNLKMPDELSEEALYDLFMLYLAMTDQYRVLGSNYVINMVTCCELIEQIFQHYLKKLYPDENDWMPIREEIIENCSEYLEWDTDHEHTVLKLINLVKPTLNDIFLSEKYSTLKHATLGAMQAYCKKYPKLTNRTGHKRATIYSEMLEQAQSNFEVEAVLYIIFAEINGDKLKRSIYRALEENCDLFLDSAEKAYIYFRDIMLEYTENCIDKYDCKEKIESIVNNTITIIIKNPTKIALLQLTDSNIMEQLNRLSQELQQASMDRVGNQEDMSSCNAPGFPGPQQNNPF